MPNNPRTHAAHAPRLRCALAVLISLMCAVVAAGQSGKKPEAKQDGKKTSAQPPAPPALKRTTTRKETRRFYYGGRVTIHGAPQGSLTIEAWPKSEVEIVADVELSADTEEDLARLAAVNTFHIDEDMNHLRVVTVGTHDRKYLKRAARDFPKKLLGLPWKIDYRIRVPSQTDLEISTGRGPLTIKDVEGALGLYTGEVEPASLTLSGGDTEATLAGGTVNLNVTARSWRGRGLSLRLARGDIRLALPAGFSGFINARVLDVGRIVNEHAELKPVERTQPTERSVQLQGGAGGATLALTVGSGTIHITQAPPKR